MDIHVKTKAAHIKDTADAYTHVQEKNKKKYRSGKNQSPKGPGGYILEEEHPGPHQNAGEIDKQKTLNGASLPAGWVSDTWQLSHSRPLQQIPHVQKRPHKTVPTQQCNPSSHTS